MTLYDIAPWPALGLVLGGSLGWLIRGWLDSVHMEESPVPTPSQDTVQVLCEMMGPHFTKYHIEGLPIPLLLHHFTQAEPHSDPHDHPWPFTSLILSGGYREEAFNPYGTSKYVDHLPGDTFHVASDHVHRITDLFEGECWTLVLPGTKEREPGFYRWEEGMPMYRQWDQPEWNLDEIHHRYIDRLTAPSPRPREMWQEEHPIGSPSCDRLLRLFNAPPFHLDGHPGKHVVRGFWERSNGVMVFDMLRVE